MSKSSRLDIFTARIIQQALKSLNDVPLHDEKATHGALGAIKTELGVGSRDVMNSLRHALTGSKVSCPGVSSLAFGTHSNMQVGPSVVEILRLLGSERTVGRLKAALELGS